MRVATLLSPLVLLNCCIFCTSWLLCAGCAVAPKAHEAADVSGFKAELDAVRIEFRDLKKTTNYDTDVWANRVLLLVPLGLSWLFMRMANKRALCEAKKHADRTALLHATCEAKKHGYVQQRRARLEQEGLEGIRAGA